MKHYDYIICGTGCSGIMLAHELSRSAVLSGKNVLLIDPKESNCIGHTIGFWTSVNDNDFESFSTSWNKISIQFDKQAIPISNGDYKYKLINGQEVYNSIIYDLKKLPNFHFNNDRVLSISENDNGAIVKTLNDEFFGRYIFNSVPPFYSEINNMNGIYTLWQHFRAMEISTDDDCFNTSTAVLMDFGIEQDSITRFAHVLPYNKKKAFVEIVTFDNNLHSNCDFEEILKNYISKNLKIDSYTIDYCEAGTIPMTEYRFRKQETKHIINLGMRSGTIKPSTGYGFTSMKSDIYKIIKALEQNCNPAIKRNIWKRRFSLYDSTLLDVLYNNRIKGSVLFTELFDKNKPGLIFKFLDEKTNIAEELSIFFKVRTIPFVKAIVFSLIRILKRNLIKAVNPIKYMKVLNQPALSFGSKR